MDALTHEKQAGEFYLPHFCSVWGLSGREGVRPH